MLPQIPTRMTRELMLWNDGRGINLEAWIGCVGNVDLAVGYTTVFWPSFELVGDYVLRAGHSAEALRGFEQQEGATPQSVEWVLNHIHLADIHSTTETEPTPEHLVFLGTVLKEIYSAKLKWQFPDRPCEVEFHIPDDPDDLLNYQLSFWQRKWSA
ncbi:hypothetical protein [Gemmobacter sp.]|uniref:hypothetical protein n=1 Tax=Gemmobacter sp. TaxID=1898957 RepID=UPI002AFE16E5|nr:hypothetical protein [Gemmobacter sp.]